LAFGQYRPVRDAAGVATAWEPWGIQVVEAVDDRIVALNSFIDPRLFTFFGLPERLEL
jgi:RNA polymerase sigma-70 factor (ECF subfamily)